MKKNLYGGLFCIMLIALTACNPAEHYGQSAMEHTGIEVLLQNSNAEKTKEKIEKIRISVGEHSFTASLADNSSVKALVELLNNNDITIPMSDYGGFEKVGILGESLPTNDEQITTAPGDLILYQGNSIAIYYAPNSWSFTRLGKIDDPTGLKEALGSGDVTVTLSIKNS